MTTNASLTPAETGARVSATTIILTATSASAPMTLVELPVEVGSTALNSK